MEDNKNEDLDEVLVENEEDKLLKFSKIRFQRASNFCSDYSKPIRETRGTGMHYIPIRRGVVDSLHLNVGDLVVSNDHGNGKISNIYVNNNSIFAHVIFNKEKFKKYGFKYPEDFKSNKIKFKNESKDMLVKGIEKYSFITI